VAAVIAILVLAGCGSPADSSPPPGAPATTAAHRAVGAPEPSVGHGQATVPPWQPAPGTDSQWRQWFSDQVSSLAGTHPEVVFIGDSITFAWSTTGASSWSRFARYQPANLGVPGDTTQNVLWRLGHDELKTLAPRVAVLMIGTNNLGRWAAPEVVAGVEAVVGSTEALLPGAHIVLLGVPPIDPPGTGRHREVADVDAALAEHYRSGPVTYLELRSVLADPDGRLHSALYHPVCVTGTTFCDQLVHPSAQGYVAMTDAVEPVITQLLG
jgi:lysophospholipase L1-like esterase